MFLRTLLALALAAALSPVDPVANTPEEFAAQIKTDLARWAIVVKAAGAKLD